MARKKKGKGHRRGRGRKKGHRATPRTVRGVFKQQPLLVKGGILLTGVEILTDTSYGGASPLKRTVAMVKGTDSVDNVVASGKQAALNLTNYYPIVIGFLAHKGAKILGIKGL